MEDVAFDFSMYEWRLGAAVGLSDRISLGATLPFRLSTTESRFRDDQGRIVSGLTPDPLHPEKRTETGLGDITTDLFVLVYNAGDTWVAFQAGVSLPIGTTARNPWKESDGDLRAAQLAFFGTGTFDPRVGFDAAVALAGLDMTAWGRGATSLYDNEWGYRAGRQLDGGLRVDPGRALGLEALRFSGSLDVQHLGQATWSGTPAQNTGRTDILVGLGVAWHVAPHLSLDITVRRPVVSWFEGGQVQWPLIVGVGLYFEDAAKAAGSTQQEERSTMETSASPTSETTHASDAATAAIRP